MTKYEILKREFDAEESTFMFILRTELKWDWSAFHRLSLAMYEVGNDEADNNSALKWMARGFWFADTWVKDWTSHPSFQRPEKLRYQKAIALLHDLAYLYFQGESPYENNQLELLVKNAI